MSHENTCDNSLALVHEQNQPLQCEFCEYCSSLKVSVKTNVASDRKKSFKFTICEYCYSVKGSMRTHVASVHEKKKSFKCTICEYILLFRKRMYV